MKLITKSILVLAATLLNWNLSVAAETVQDLMADVISYETNPHGPTPTSGSVYGPTPTSGSVSAGNVGPQGPQGVQGPQGLAGSGAPCSPYIIGDTGPDGGKVFYVDGSGCHGLEAQAANASNSIRMNWATAISVSAAYNSPACATNAQLTLSCWHLPSKTELNYLYEQKAVLGGIANTIYWSSTDCAYPGAWTQTFVNGNQKCQNKASVYIVRAVRSF